MVGLIETQDPIHGATIGLTKKVKVCHEIVKLIPGKPVIKAGFDWVDRVIPA